MAPARNSGVAMRPATVMPLGIVERAPWLQQTASSIFFTPAYGDNEMPQTRGVRKAFAE